MGIKGDGTSANKQYAGSFNLFFVKPRKNLNASKAVRKLLESSEVKEVAIGEGEYGIVVKARLNDENESLERSIAGLGKYSKVACYCNYKR